MVSRDCFVALPRGATVCLQFVIVVFPDHTHLLYLRIFTGEVIIYAHMGIFTTSCSVLFMP